LSVRFTASSALSTARVCGRFVRTSPRAVLVDEFGVEHFVNVDFTRRYNIAPSLCVETIVNDGTELRMEPMRWGFTAEATVPGF
jgi:putative SOS response-associated peptidase YedK